MFKYILSCLVKSPLVYLVAESLGSDVQGPRIWLKFGAFPRPVRLCKNRWFILKWSGDELNSQDFWWQGLRPVLVCKQFHSSRPHERRAELIFGQNKHRSGKILTNIISAKAIHLFGWWQIHLAYSLVRLVVPNTEELISRPLTGL